MIRGKTIGLPLQVDGPLIPAMKPQSWKEIEELFQGALLLEPGRRAAFLSESCHDETLRREVQSLLQAHERAGSFTGVSKTAVASELAAQQRDANPSGERIGPYQIVRELGQGGMGSVYLAVRADQAYRKQVAIKLIKRGMDTDFIIGRFRNERQILAALDHPNIARLLDGGATDDGLPYFVMEYVDGLPIDEYCDRQKLPTAERLRLFLTVCSAVQYAHQNLVVHRDLKPSNIVVTAEGIPKLLDFGIAKVLRPDQSFQTIEHTVVRLMTPRYASPEQILGGPITTASDVYSLGVLLYELLTGHRPYRLKSELAEEAAQAVAEQEPEKPSVVVDRVVEIRSESSPPITLTPESVSQTRDAQPGRLRRALAGDIDNIVLKSLRKETQRRYASVEKLAEDIRHHLEGLPVAARKDSFGYRGGKFIRRHKFGVIATVTIVITLLAGVVATARQARIARAERDKARIEASKAERISAFLQGMLSSADPETKGRETKVIDVLDEASRRAEVELSTQPEVLAAVRRTIGATYRKLGLYDLAERLLKAALEADRKIFGEEHVETATTEFELGSLWSEKGNYADSESLLRQALATRSKLLGGQHRDVAYAAGDLAVLLVEKGELNQAEPLYQQALAILGVQPDDEETRRAIAATLNNLAALKSGRGDVDGAQALFKESITICRKERGALLHRTLAAAVQNLGAIYKTQGRYGEAEPLLREAVELRRSLLGESHPHLAIAQIQLGELLYLRGRYQPARQEVEAALEIQKRTLSKGHIDFSRSYAVLGAILTASGDPRAGEALLREAVEIRRDKLPKGNWITALAESELGSCLRVQKRYAEAEPWLISSFEALKSGVGEKHPKTQEALQRIVVLYESWGRSAQAEAYRAQQANGEK